MIIKQTVTFSSLHLFKMNQLQLLIFIGLISTSIGCWDSSQQLNNIDHASLFPNEFLDSLTTYRSESEDRFAWQKPDLVISKLGELNGKVIADIGAGTGYFTFRLYRNAKKVIATEIDTNLIDLIEVLKSDLDLEEQKKIETRLDYKNRPNLGEEEVDIAMIINTVGYLEDKALYLSEIRKSLTEKGELVIVDFNMKDIPESIAPPVEYRVSLLQLEHLLEEVGYTSVVVDYRSLEYQYIVKARKG